VVVVVVVGGEHDDDDDDDNNSDDISFPFLSIPEQTTIISHVVLQADSFIYCTIIIIIVVVIVIEELKHIVRGNTAFLGIPRDTPPTHPSVRATV
jgi:hypothetical protein